MNTAQITENKVLNAYDSDIDEFVKITPDTRRLAHYVYQQFQMSELLNAAALLKLTEEKLYLALGYESRDEFIINGTNYGVRTAQRLCTVARKFKPYLPELNEAKQLTEGGSSDTLEDATTLSSLQNMGISKLYELSKLDDKDLEELMKTGKLGEGDDEVTLEEINEMAVRKATVELKKATAKHKEKIKKLEDDRATLKEENKLLESELETYKEKAEHADELEKEFGAAASTIQQKKDLMAECENLIEKLEHLMNKANVTADDTPKIVDKYQTLLRDINKMYETLLDNFGVIE